MEMSAPTHADPKRDTEECGEQESGDGAVGTVQDVQVVGMGEDRNAVLGIRAQPLGDYRERVGRAPEGSDGEPFHAGVPEPSRAQVAKPHHPEPPVGHPTDPSETKPAQSSGFRCAAYDWYASL